MQFRLVFRAEVEADDGGGADGVANKDGDKDKADVHHDAVGGDAVLTQEFQKLEIIYHGYDGAGYVAHELRGAVAAGLKQRLCFHPDRAQMQGAAVVLFQEEDQGNQCAHGLAQAGGQSRARHTPPQHTHKQCVQNHVGNTCGHRGNESQTGLFRGNQKALEDILQHESDVKGDDDTAVEYAVGYHFLRSAQKSGDRLHEQKANGGQRRTQQDGQLDHHGKIPVGLFAVSGTQVTGHQSRAAGADHEAHTAQDHQKGPDKVQSRKGGLSGKIGNEKAVYHAVDGSKDHHGDGGQGEPEELSVGKVVG